MKKSKRNELFDIEKGILIVFVVLGHLIDSDSKLHQVIFSFHMPVFFMLTGMLSHWDVDKKDFIRKRTLSYVIPYFSWCVLLFIFFWIENPLKYIIRIIYGGAMNSTAYTYPFWFINCLFMSSIIFKLCFCRVRWLFIALCGWLIIWYMFLTNVDIPPLPWSLEVVPFVLLYFYLGIISKKLEGIALNRLGWGGI